MNICIDCIHAVPDNEGHGCPWSREFKPVPGWDAEPTKLKTAVVAGKKYYSDSYNIKSCPLFKEG